MHVSAKNNQICFYHIELIMLAYIYSNTRLIKMHGLIRQTQIDHYFSICTLLVFAEYNISMCVRTFQKDHLLFSRSQAGSLCAREFFTWRT